MSEHSQNLITSLTEKFNTPVTKYLENYKYHSTSSQQNVKDIQIGFDITAIPPEGKTIIMAGPYVVLNDLYWNPVTDATAISILVNGVTIDFQGYSLICQNQIYKTTGIESFGGNNITVINGIIKQVSYVGIYFSLCADIQIQDFTVQGLSWEDLSIRDVTPSGIFLQGCYNSTIINCHVKDVKVKTDSSAGFLLTECDLATINNCRVSNFINLDGAVQGFAYILSINIETTNSHSFKLRSFFKNNILTTGHTVLGFVCIASTFLTYFKCSSRSIIGSCDDVHGISLFLISNVKVNEFFVKNVVDGVTSTKTGAKATGIEVYGSDVTVSNCKVVDILAIRPQDKQCTGFSAARGSNIKFRNCIAKNVNVLNAQIQKDIRFGRGTGFGWAPDPRAAFAMPAYNVTYKNCTAINCQVGFDSWYHINSLWKNVTTRNCIICILKNVRKKRTLYCNQCSECNPPKTTTLKNVAKGNRFENIYCLNIRSPCCKI